MPKFKTKPEFVEAEQWFKGKSVEGVIEKKFVPSGHWSDRFEDHPDVFIETPMGKIGVYEGNWIITDAKGSKWVFTSEKFDKTYEPVND